MSQACMILLVTVPLATTLVTAVLPYRAASALTVVVGIASFAFSLPLVAAAAHGSVEAGPYLRADAISVVFLIATAFLYATTSVYAVGYFAQRARLARRSPDPSAFGRYSRRFYAGFNAFAWALLCAPLVNGLALLWIAIEVTTVVSALLVALDGTDRATEAAWKYVLIASSGLGIALLATIVMYYAGAQALGDSYDLAFGPLLGAARHLPAVPVQLAFALAVIGFGTKVGLFPVHTWLPDAHAEAPTPVSVLLSGALLGTSFYAIIRYFQIARAAVGPAFPQTILAVFGVLSLLLAALYLFGQRDIKRMLAYSSVEHMGVLAISLSLGAPLALAGLLLHVLGHAAGKSTAFMGAGVLVHKFGTKELGRMRGGLAALPVTGALFLMAVLAICAFPPFAIFRSEFMIVAGGIQSSHGAVSVILVALVTLAFFGLTLTTTQVLFQPAEAPVPRGEPSMWMAVPMMLGLAALLLLGVHPGGDIVALLHQGALELAGGVG